MQATGIATIGPEVNHGLVENQNLKEIFNPDQLVEAISKVVSNITMRQGPKTLQGTQY